MFGMFDMLLTFVGVGRDKILVNGETDQVNAILESMLFDLLHIGIVFTFHLAMEDVNALDAKFSRPVDDRFNGIFCVSEMPVGIA